jgi:hypothetical protein
MKGKEFIMREMKRILSVLISIVLLLVFTGCENGYRSITGNPGHAQLAMPFNTLDELSVASPIVIRCKLQGKNEGFIYSEVEFVKSKVKVLNIFRSDEDFMENETIAVLQTYIEEDPILSKNNEYVLFLRKYDGPVTDNAYIIVGAMQGQFNVKNEKLYSKTNLKNKLNENIRDYNKTGKRANISELIKCLNKNKFNKDKFATKENKQSKDEIERQNQDEKRKEQDAKKSK